MLSFIKFRKDKDWPKCKFCNADLNSFLEIFGKTIFEKCPNKDKIAVDYLKHTDFKPYRCDGPWSK